MPLTVYERKETWVRLFVKPMLVAMNIGITDCEYYVSHDADRGTTTEYVGVRYGQHEILVNVTGDSYKAILEDMVRQEAIK